MRIGELYVNNQWDILFKQYPDITKPIIYSICSYYQIKKESYFWNKEDEQYLIDNYGKIPLKEIEAGLKNKYKPNAIKTKAQKMGLGSNPFWTEQEDEILINNYSYVPKEQMKKMLPGRTFEAIVSRAKKLGQISFHRLSERYTLEQKQFIKDNWEKLTDQEIAEILGKSIHGIMDQRSNMGLLRCNKKYAKYENIMKFFRGHIQDWKVRSMEACGHKCIFTGDSNFIIHHIYGFNNIVAEAFSEIEKTIPLRSTNVEDYSFEEL